MANYFTLLTKIGLARVANAVALNQTVSITKMAVGDGNNAPTTPSENQTALVRERYRASINQLTIDSENPNYIIAEMIIPTNVGGWSVHEVGIFDSADNLVAIANFPATYKPQLAEGSGRDLVVRIYIQVSNTGVVQLIVDPAVVLASQKWVADNFARLSGANFTGPTTGVTPPQFDTTGKFATMAAVKREIGSHSALVAIAGASVLSASAAGRLHSINGSFAVTLPAANSVTSGTSVAFVSQGNSSISTQGGNNINTGVGNVSTVSMAAGETLILTSDNANWYMEGGSVHLKYAASFKSSLGGSGYQKIPGGLIIQWGQTTAGSANGSVTTNLPIAFPNGFATLVASHYGSDQGISIIGDASISNLSQFALKSNYQPAGGVLARWIAIGY